MSATTRPADLFANRMHGVLVAAPAPGGRLGPLVETRLVALERNGEVHSGLTRWIFADVPRGTLRDDWGNPYDHEVHTLLAGTLAEGEAFLRAMVDAGFVVADAPDLFVPLQTLDAADRDASDQLRTRFPRAFALARRGRPTLQQLVTSLRDAALLSR
jgi:hypothetical protein